MDVPMSEYNKPDSETNMRKRKGSMLMGGISGTQVLGNVAVQDP